MDVTNLAVQDSALVNPLTGSTFNNELIVNPKGLDATARLAESRINARNSRTQKLTDQLPNSPLAALLTVVNAQGGNDIRRQLNDLRGLEKKRLADEAKAEAEGNARAAKIKDLKDTKQIDDFMRVAKQNYGGDIDLALKSKDLTKEMLALPPSVDRLAQVQSLIEKYQKQIEESSLGVDDRATIDLQNAIDRLRHSVLGQGRPFTTGRLNDEEKLAVTKKPEKKGTTAPVPLTNTQKKMQDRMSKNRPQPKPPTAAPEGFQTLSDPSFDGQFFEGRKIGEDPTLGTAAKDFFANVESWLRNMAPNEIKESPDKTVKVRKTANGSLVIKKQGQPAVVVKDEKEGAKVVTSGTDSSGSFAAPVPTVKEEGAPVTKENFDDVLNSKFNTGGGGGEVIVEGEGRFDANEQSEKFVVIEGKKMSEAVAKDLKKKQAKDANNKRIQRDKDRIAAIENMSPEIKILKDFADTEIHAATGMTLGDFAHMVHELSLIHI
jgi:hypothetical protein